MHGNDNPCLAPIKAGYAKHQVEVRSVTKRQVYVGGEPVGIVF